MFMSDGFFAQLSLFHKYRYRKAVHCVHVVDMGDMGLKERIFNKQQNHFQ